MTTTTVRAFASLRAPSDGQLITFSKWIIYNDCIFNVSCIFFKYYLFEKRLLNFQMDILIHIII